MMLAIAFESLVKLIAFLSVGIFVSFIIFDSPIDIFQQASVSLNKQHPLPNIAATLGMLIIVMAAFLSLPRQFQVMVVELQDEKDTWLSRRIFPIYLLVFAIFAAPLGLAGQILLGDQVPSDAYVLFLPWHENQTLLTLFSFLGAISAASSMVIISSIALSTMLSNEIVFPFLFKVVKKQQVNYEQFRHRLLNIRKALVLIVILFGYSVFLIAPADTLSSLGEIAFGAIAQLTPALIVAFYWRRASLLGVFGGIIVGFLLWFLLNFLPHLGIYPALLTDGLLPANTLVTLISLGANIFVMWSLSQVTRQSVQERVQATLFLESKIAQAVIAQKLRPLNIEELRLLTTKFLGDEKSKASFAHLKKHVDKKSMSTRVYNQTLLHHTENMLASVMGASSARLVLSSALEGRDIDLDEMAVLVEEASTQQQLASQNLLQSAIENASEGISIIDSNLNLVAWNKKYLELFNYPEHLIFTGCPIEKLITYNAERGLCGQGDIAQQVSSRINFLKQGSPHSSERQHSSGQVIRIEGNPLPDGGFVMLFSDITVYRQAEQVLTEENQDLETRVTERTQKLAEANKALEITQKKAEQANLKKSQYLKACSHDLMQPLEAARLFTSALSFKNDLNSVQKQQVDNIDHSLKVANELLANLGEIARIESGNIKPMLEVFSLNRLLLDLEREFSAQALEHSIDFHITPTELWVLSDKHLLARILQNLLGNAFRYANESKVELYASSHHNKVEIHVKDGGPGIPADKQSLVFEQFTQLQTSNKLSAQGLGLGLSITQSLASILNHSLKLDSAEGRGCEFTICLPQAAPITYREPIFTQSAVSLQGVSVLCIDNDPAVLKGMIELLSAWKCHVYSADSTISAKEVYTDTKNNVDILLVDYQLEDGRDGLTLIDELRQSDGKKVPAILITATTDDSVEEKAKRANIGYMRKLVRPASLRAMMSAMLAKSLKENYQ
jgi:signal transduction histidine kinase